MCLSSGIQFYNMGITIAMRRFRFRAVHIRQISLKPFIFFPHCCLSLEKTCIYVRVLRQDKVDIAFHRFLIYDVMSTAHSAYSFLNEYMPYVYSSK